MSKKRRSPDEIIRLLRQAEIELGAGSPVAVVCQKLGISEQTYYGWRKSYGGMRPDEMKRLRALESENARLRKLVASQALDNQILKEALEGNF